MQSEVPNSIEPNLAEIILEEDSNGIICVNSLCSIERMNRSAKLLMRKLFSKEPESWPLLWDYIPAERKPEWKTQIDSAFAGSVTSIIESFDVADETHSFEIEFKRVDSGQQNFVVIFIRDITLDRQTEVALKRSIRELQEAIETRDIVFSLISHELRSPIFQINGLIFLLQQILDGKAKIQDIDKFMPDMDSRVRHLTHTLDNLLKWAVAQKDKLVMRNRIFHIQDEIDHAVGLLQHPMSKKDISLTQEVSGEEVVSSDREMIAILLRNFLSNAFKYSPVGGKIILRVQCSSKEIFIQVTDNGVGMDQDSINKLLSPHAFYSEKGSTGEVGAGIGMKLVLKVINALNGELKISSKPEEGTIISAFIPIVKEGS